MIFSTKLPRCLLLLPLVILPINFRIINQSSLFVQEWMGVEPTVRSTNSTSDDTTSNEALLGSEDLDAPRLLSRQQLIPTPSTETTADRIEDPPETQQEGNEEESQGEEDEENVDQEEQIEEPTEIPPKPQSPQEENRAEETKAANKEQTIQVQQRDTIASKEGPNTFSACLQIMDDNHFLIEWLAYHYHVMPLRRLIVLVDPNSRSSPQPILDRWKDRMHITVWNDTHVYPQGGGPNPATTTKLFQHRHRQRQFVRRCLQKLHKQKRGWVFLTDTDEYVMINDRVRNPSDYLSPMSYAGKELAIPDHQEPGSVIRFLKMKETINPHTNQTLWNIPCLTIARKTFGTKEGKEQEPVLGYNQRDFQTLHWRKYGTTPKPGKSIVNLKYFKYKDINNNPSIHRPGKNEICRGKMWLPENLSVIIANHYPGTLEQMLFRQQDARGDDKKFNNATKYRIQRFKDYKKLSKFKDGDTIRKWLPGFIASVGEQEAKKLLQYAGRPAEASYLDAATLGVATADAVQENVVEDAAAEQENGNSQISLIASKDDPNTFAGCLLLMDDNHFLIEWIAYHYHVMPLRRLIVVTDPHSRTSPAPILQRWKDRIHITLWNEKHIHPNGIPPPLSKHKKQTRVGQHRSRQRRFVRMCLQALIKEGREWVVLTDTDEYTMINKRLRNKEDKLSPLKYAAKKDLEIPSQREPGSVMKLLGMKDIVLHTKQHFYDNPCITMARKTFGTKTMNTTGEIAGYDASNFQTLNWRYYVNDKKPGKTVVNLAHVTQKDIPAYPSVHRPFTEGDICKGKIALSEHISPLVANHYPGNLQQMLFRTHDSRGNHTNATAYRVERFNNYTKIDKSFESETIQEWLPGFIDSVGTAEAARLLKFVGDVELAAGPISYNATLNDPPVIEFGKPTTQILRKMAPVQQARVDETPDLQDTETTETNTDSDQSSEPVSREDPEAFASCLMVKGDDPLLIEWIAYHYHVMPLRRLVLLADPTSQAPPQDLLDRWQEQMDITLWTRDYFDLSAIKGSETQKLKTLQRTFIRRCLKRLHKEGREWVFLTAVDEYTTINDRVRNATDPLSFVKSGGTPLPDAWAPGAILELLRRNDARIPHTDENAKDSACITMSRKTFGDKEGPAAVPISGLDTSNLQTFKWRYFEDESKAGRSLLNLKKIKFSDLKMNPSPTRPVTAKDVCKGTLRLSERQSIIVVNRYTRGLNLEDELNSLQLEPVTIQSWLPGFVDSVGEEAAKDFLAPVEVVAASA